MGRPFTSKADGPISDGPIGEVKSNYGLGTIGGYGSGLSISSGLMETIPASFSNDTSDKKMSNGASNGATSGSNSSWTSIFGLSSRNPLPLPPAPISIGDKIVVVPPDEVIAQEVGVWENSIVAQLVEAKNALYCHLSDYRETLGKN